MARVCGEAAVLIVAQEMKAWQPTEGTVTGEWEPLAREQDETQLQRPKSRPEAPLGQEDGVTARPLVDRKRAPDRS